MSGRNIQPNQQRKDMRPRAENRPRMARPKEHGTHAKKAKPAGATVCDQCGVVYHGGRWYWGSPPSLDVSAGLCPACERIRDRFPAGTIQVPEDFLKQREEVLNLIENAEEAEKAEHPLERVMAISDGPEGGLVVTTTGIHLARAITSKLERRFHRQARIRYPEEPNLVYVDWNA